MSYEQGEQRPQATQPAHKDESYGESPARPEAQADNPNVPPIATDTLVQPSERNAHHENRERKLQQERFALAWCHRLADPEVYYRGDPAGMVRLDVAEA